MTDQTPPSFQNDALQEEVHLQDYLNVLIRRRRPAIGLFLLVVLVVIGWTLWMRPVYEASATLHVRDEKAKGGDLLGDLGLSRQSPIETEIEILQSRSNAEETVRRLHLDWKVEKKGTLSFKILEFKSTAENPTYSIVITGKDLFRVEDADGKALGEGHSGSRFQGGGVSLVIDQLDGKVGDKAKISRESFVETVQNLRSNLRASEVGKGTNIIRLVYQSTDPAKAMEVVNTLSGVYLERGVLLKAEEARKSVEFINQQLDEVRDLLDGAEHDLEEYKRSSGVISLDSEAAALINRVAEAETAKSTALLRQSQARFAIEALEDALARKVSYSPGALIDDPVIAEMARTLAQLEVERQGLLIQFTDSHPRLQAIRDQIAQTQKKMQATYQSLQQAMGSVVAGLDLQIRGFEAQLKKLPATEQQLAKLTRLAKVNADIYTFLLQKHEEARIARASTISSIDVIDPAILPDKPIKPNKKKNLLLGLILGLMLGGGLAFFLEYLDDTIKDSDSAKRLLGLPVLAVIPQIGQRKKAEAGEEGEIKRTLITHLEPKSGPAEAFRALRTAIHFSSRQSKQVILVTSSFPGEGKTTVSANLAETLSQTGAKVLLIGCDLRRPTLHTVFDRAKTPGLTEYLVGDAGLEQIIHQTGTHSLDFISAGTIPPNPAELLGSEAMKTLLDKFREDYDTIILDAPPMLAVTDASLLTAFSDQVVMVLEAGGVKIKPARRVVELLHAANANIAGIALNDKTGKGSEYYGYGYYSSDSGEEPGGKRSLISRLFKR